MTPEVLEIEQRSDAWFEQRMGRVTASRFKDVLAANKNGSPSAKRERYKQEIVNERFGRTVERYTSAAMEVGVETEELAQIEYTLKTGNLVDECGLFLHPKLMAGASPDGLIGEDGLIEIKCRELYNHIKMLKTDTVDDEYFPQLQGQLWVTGRKWVDFVAFAPEYPPNAQLFIKRVERDETYIKSLEAEVTRFLAEVEADINFVREYRR